MTSMSLRLNPLASRSRTVLCACDQESNNPTTVLMAEPPVSRARTPAGARVCVHYDAALNKYATPQIERPRQGSRWNPYESLSAWSHVLSPTRPDRSVAKPSENVLDEIREDLNAVRFRFCKGTASYQSPW